MIMNEKYKASGSSPLARGLRSRSTPPPRGIGIIPARAGFTLGRVGGPQEPMDHPRSRGVYREGLLVQPQRGGSSPLARGLPAALNAEGYAVRIIPARAGFTPRRGPARRRRGDHPRSRGVYPGEAEPPHGVDGSSPLARGLPLRALVLAAYGGIIPARAGFTTARPSTRRPSGDHPRSRGVYLWSRDEYDVARGSSPLARGLPMSRWRKESSSGIIPARAGFTSPAPGRRRQCRDHPRSRGVYNLAVSWAETGRGSSPLARGLQGERERPERIRRIIPARAGFTSRRLRRVTVAWDHPRSRGVYRALASASPQRSGSSPLARGLRDLALLHGLPERIIPARAGFTG